MKNDPLDSFYRERLNLQKAQFSLIEHEDAIVATVYKVTLTSGEECILKICTHLGHFLREVYFLNHFAGKLPVPRIIDIVQPEQDVHGAILMQCLAGSVIQMTDLDTELAFEMGSFLARIHLESVKGYGDLTQPAHLSSDPRIFFAFKFEEGLQECSGDLPAGIISKCRHYFDEHIDLLKTVDGPCIVHSDFRPGNVFVREGRVDGIIDWSSAHGGFAEEDFCPLELGEWSTERLQIKNSFLRGYASVRKVPEYQDVMPLLLLNRAIATMGFTIKSGTWQSKNASLYQQRLQSLKSILNEE